MALIFEGEKIGRNRFTGEKIENATNGIHSLTPPCRHECFIRDLFKQV